MQYPDPEKEFVAIIKQYEKMIYKVCSFYISAMHPISDLYQEVVYTLWKNFPKFRNECSISTWIYRVALNTCISGIRKDKRQIDHETDFENIFTASEDDADEENIKEMYQLIYQLKELERAIVLLYLEGRSYKEIAEITGLTLTNVATKLNRIKEKLKQLSNAFS